MIGAREKFRDLIQRVGGTVTTWAKDPRPMMAPALGVPVGATMAPSVPTATVAGLTGQAHVTLRVLSAITVGDDEERKLYDQPTDKLRITLSGLRTYTIQVTCTTIAASASAADILELLRTRLQRKSVTKELHEINMSVVDLMAIHDISPTNSTHAGQTATMDLKFHYGMNDEDLSFDGAYVDTIGPIVGVP